MDAVLWRLIGWKIEACVNDMVVKFEYCEKHIEDLDKFLSHSESILMVVDYFMK